MRLIIGALIFGMATTVASAQGKDDAPGLGSKGQSLGHVTEAAIENGFDQGAHASDPSGDGHGPGTDDEPRSGLANVAEQGNLGATIDVIDP